jgi:hypothetical protein
MRLAASGASGGSAKLQDLQEHPFIRDAVRRNELVDQSIVRGPPHPRRLFGRIGAIRLPAELPAELACAPLGLTASACAELASGQDRGSLPQGRSLVRFARHGLILVSVFRVRKANPLARPRPYVLAIDRAD